MHKGYKWEDEMFLGNKPKPGPFVLVPDQSGDLVKSCAFAGLDVVSIMSLHASPIVADCNEAWKPIFEAAAELHGYCWEWIETEPLTEAQKEFPWMSPLGRVVLHYIG